MTVLSKLSPNFTAGRSGYKPEAVVIHVMAGTLSGTDSWFASPSSQVSAHYGIGHDGEVHQYVHEQDTAWHAGGVDKPTWALRKPGVNPNLYTIGIEHEGFDMSKDATLVQKQTSAALIREICGRWGIPIDRQHIIGHYEINGVRKANCPATDKSVIDELIALAQPETPPVSSKMPPAVAAALETIESAVAAIKAAYM